MITCAFVHGSVMHILFNGYALYKIGKMLEFLTNRGILLVVYFLAIVLGSSFSMIFMPEATSLGASGGIIGLFGLLAVVAYKRRAFMPPGFLKSILNNLVIIAVIGAIGHNFIDNASHAGGLLAGIVVGWFLIPERGMLPVRSSKTMKWIGNILFGFYVLSSLFSLFMIAYVHALR
ncbi:rhomboid family intramembrane serine protease [bacterium]|nr:rhomboid family intramembrane serine protease [bacterium]